MARSEPETTRPVPHGRTVLVRGGRHGTWTGQLRRWHRHNGTWYGAVTWDQLGVPRSALVHATRLRPLAIPRAVEVHLWDTWQPGRLHAWRKQPGYSYWEGEVSLNGHNTADWYRHGLIRPTADTTIWDQAF